MRHTIRGARSGHPGGVRVRDDGGEVAFFDEEFLEDRKGGCFAFDGGRRETPRF